MDADCIYIIEVRISIHALREEGDPSINGGSRFSSRFLSTPSARRATTKFSTGKKAINISIHALREEGDNSINKRSICKH